jgi:ketopantoate hydroxymethyltransferase
MQDAGASCGARNGPSRLAKTITLDLEIPSASRRPDCDGQVLVLHTCSGFIASGRNSQKNFMQGAPAQAAVAITA